LPRLYATGGRLSSLCHAGALQVAAGPEMCFLQRHWRTCQAAAALGSSSRISGRPDDGRGDAV